MNTANRFTARHAMGRRVVGQALVAHDGFSARYDLNRLHGVFSRPAHKLAGQNCVDRILVLDTAKGGVGTAWMLHEMRSRNMAPTAIVVAGTDTRHCPGPRAEVVATANQPTHHQEQWPCTIC